MSPSGLCSILSMPFGPIELRMTRATALAALMLAFWASSPLMRLLRSCSCAHRRLPDQCECIKQGICDMSTPWLMMHADRKASEEVDTDLDDDERPAILIEGQTHRVQRGGAQGAGPSS